MLAFREFMNQENEDKCLEDEVKHHKTDIESKTEVEKLMSAEPIGRFQGMEKGKRNEILRNRRRIAQTDLSSYRPECRCYFQ